MSPATAFQRVVDAATVATAVGPYRPIQDYIRRGEPIPDALLPGRLLMRQPAKVRAALQGLTSATAADVAPWVIRGDG